MVVLRLHVEGHEPKPMARLVRKLRDGERRRIYATFLAPELDSWEGLKTHEAILSVVKDYYLQLQHLSPDGGRAVKVTTTHRATTPWYVFNLLKVTPTRVEVQGYSNMQTFTFNRENGKQIGSKGPALYRLDVEEFERLAQEKA